MYKVTIRIQDKAGKKDEKKVFELGDMDSAEYDMQMNAISDYLYELDIPFEVDEDGDMMIDDMLVSISEEEDFEEKIAVKKAVYTIQGKLEE